MSKKYEIKVFENDPGECDLNFKIIVIGDSSVGKSCLVLRATKGTFESLYTPTVGFEFLTFYIKIDSVHIKLQIWDTCGQEVYRSLIGSFYRNSSLALIVYSIDNENSFKNVDSWLNELKTKGNPEIITFLVGNKADLEDKRVISKEMLNDLCESHKIKYFLETSAKTGFNVQNIFIEAAKVLFEQHEKFKDRISRIDSFYDMEKKNQSQNLEKEEDKDNSKGERKVGCC